ncbi:MAG: small, acid-soluble spore protein, alpha/beta type [Candidatus Bathyarchaeota archaeon]|nr:small, acid-soluble spore protein, alpha/beta type [Candidatus Bathyarchaeota archaeon]
MSRKSKNRDLTVEEAGRMGGQKVRRLIEEGKEQEKNLR